MDSIYRDRQRQRIKLSASYALGGGVNAFFVNRSGTDVLNATKDFQAVGVNFTF